MNGTRPERPDLDQGVRTAQARLLDPAFQVIDADQPLGRLANDLPLEIKRDGFVVISEDALGQAGRGAGERERLLEMAVGPDVEKRPEPAQVIQYAVEVDVVEIRHHQRGRLQRQPVEMAGNVGGGEAHAAAPAAERGVAIVDRRAANDQRHPRGFG